MPVSHTIYLFKASVVSAVAWYDLEQCADGVVKVVFELASCIETPESERDGINTARKGKGKEGTSDWVRDTLTKWWKNEGGWKSVFERVLRRSVRPFYSPFWNQGPT